MTLEHVHNTGEFIRDLRATVGDHPETVVFFMIPEITRILNLAAFWDVYYEHCSYFSPGSLARTFRRAGLDPIEVWTDYEDQYVLIAARPGQGKGPVLANEAPPDALLPRSAPSPSGSPRIAIAGSASCARRGPPASARCSGAAARRGSRS